MRTSTAPQGRAFEPRTTPQAGRPRAHPEAVGGPGSHPVVTVSVVDDNPLIVLGVARMLEPFADALLVVDAPGPGSPVDVTLCGVSLAALNGSAGQRDLLDTVLTDPARGLVLAYTWDQEPGLVEASVARGFAGVVDKRCSAVDLQAAVLAAVGSRPVRSRPEGATLPVPHGHDEASSRLAREHGLSGREVQMMCLITSGLTNQEISLRCGLSLNTVKSYIRSLYTKLGLSRRPEAVRWGVQHLRRAQHGQERSG